MSDLLNRLVSRAGGDPTGSRLKIEPVRVPRYTAFRNVVPAEAREAARPSSDGASGPAKRLDTGWAQPLDSGVNSTRDGAAGVVASNDSGTGRGRDSAAISTVAATSFASQTSTRSDASRMATPLRDSIDRESRLEKPSEIPARALGTQGRELELREEASTVGHPPGRADTTASRITPVGAPTAEAAGGPSIVVSIGHVEVRSKPAPAPPPIQRRPAFRPRLSLEAFLGGDGGRKP